MFVKHVCPPKLKCHCDLDFWPRNPKFFRGHLLVMINNYTKLEDPSAIFSYWSDKVCLRTNWHMQRNIPPTSLKSYLEIPGDQQMFSQSWEVVDTFDQFHNHTVRLPFLHLNSTNLCTVSLLKMNIKMCNKTQHLKRNNHVNSVSYHM